MVSPAPQELERRIHRYRRLAERYGRLYARVDGVISRIAVVRFVAFAVAFLCAIAGFYERSWLPWYGPMVALGLTDRKSTRLNSSHLSRSRMPSSA